MRLKNPLCIFLNSALHCKLAETLYCTGGTLGLRGTQVENHWFMDWCLTVCFGLQHQ